jgi:PAS domain S-box-containing protein
MSDYRAARSAAVRATRGLMRRSARSRNVAAENAANAMLLEALTIGAGDAMPRIADTVRSLCEADSAGVMLVEADAAPAVGRWAAMVGALAPFAGATEALNASASAIAIDHGGALLFERPGHHFPALARLEPPIVEAIVVPFSVDAVPAGTLWAIAHDESRRFDAEDQRLLIHLARLAALARRLTLVQARAETERLLRTVVDLVPDLLWRADANGSITWANRRLLEYAGKSLDGASGLSLVETIHPDERDVTLSTYLDAVRRGSRFRHEHRMRRADGMYRWFLVEAVPVRDVEGNIVEWFGSATDVDSERNAKARLEALVEERTQSLAESEARLRIALEAADLGTWDLDLTTDTSTARSLRHDQIFGYEARQREWGREIAVRHVLPEDRTIFEQAFVDAAETGKLTCEVRVRWPDNTVHWVAPRGRTYYDEAGRAVRMVGVVADVTHRKRTEAQLRDMAARLTMAEQEERRRISQVLHDDLQQILYGAQLRLTMMQHRLRKKRDTALLDQLTQTHHWVSRGIEATRQLAVELSPPILQTEGLADALRWLQRQMEDLHGLVVTLHAPHSFYMADADLRVLLFQVVRELLFNIKKHAKTDHARIELKEVSAHYVVVVSDEGRGFDLKALTERETGEAGLGLFSARERLELVGGHMEIDTVPGGGTRVSIHSPRVRKRGARRRKDA